MLFWADIAGAAALFLVARFSLDQAARYLHWRVGRLGFLLAFRGRTRSACFRCRTDWRWALPHDIPIALEHGLCIFPLCQKCWTETGKPERLAACAELMNVWIADGRYGDSRRFDQPRYDDERVAIYAAVEAGL